MIQVQILSKFPKAKKAASSGVFFTVYWSKTVNVLNVAEQADRENRPI